MSARAIAVPAQAQAAPALAVPALAALALAAAAACDVAPALVPPETPGDGVAPWAVVASPLLLCDGDRRLVAPDEGGTSPRIAGACLTGAETGIVCATDAECGPRTRCLCGRCRPPVCTDADRTSCAEGDECVQTSAAGGGAKRCLVPCVADDDCGANERCGEHPDGRRACIGTCAAATDCATGETCNASGTCVLALCASDDLTCTGGRTCALEGVVALATGPSALVADDGAASASGAGAASDDGPPVDLWFARDGEIWHARAPDALAFATDESGPAAVPTAAWEGTALAAPAVAAGTDGTLRLFYAAGDGAGIGLLTSTDGGATWSAAAAPVLAAAESFEGTRVSSPSAALDGDTGEWLLFYEGGDGAGIGLARSTDGAVFAPDPEPALLPGDVEDPRTSPPATGCDDLTGEAFWRDVTWLGAPHARFDRDATGLGRVRLWFAARGVESEDACLMGALDPAQPNDSIGYAVSIDGGARFEVYPFNPVFDRTAVAITHFGENGPSVAARAGRWWMYFDGASESGADPQGLSVAVSP